MSKYTVQQLNAMEDDELSIAYEEILLKSMPNTKKRPAIIKEIIAAQAEQEEVEKEKKKKTTASKPPVSSVRSTLLKPKSPPRSSIVKLSSPRKRSSPRAKETAATIDPQTVSIGLVEEDIETESRRGRPPKKIEKISSEDTEVYVPPKEPKGKRVETIKVDKVLEEIRSAKTKLMKAREQNLSASFQGGDTIENETPAISGTTLKTIEIPIHEDSKKSILEFLHDVQRGEEETLESAPKTPGKKASRKSVDSGAPDTEPNTPGRRVSKIITVDEELERLASVPEDTPEIESKNVKSVSSKEPVKQGKLERKTTKAEVEESIEEELRYEKERQLRLEKDRELSSRFTRRPVQIKQVTEEGEEVEEEVPEEDVFPEEAPEEDVFPEEAPEEDVFPEEVPEEDDNEEETRKLLKNPSKWINTSIDNIPISEFKTQTSKKKTEILTEIREPAPLVVRKSNKKTKIEDTETGPKEVIKSSKITEEKIEYPEDDVELLGSKPSSKKVKSKKPEPEDEELLVKKSTKSKKQEPEEEELLVKKSTKSKKQEPEDDVELIESSKKKSTKSKKQEPELVEDDVELIESKPSSKKKKPSKYEKVDVVPILEQVDKSRLASGRGKNLYNLKEIQDILRQIPGVKTTGKKEELVERLQEELKKYGL